MVGEGHIPSRIAPKPNKYWKPYLILGIITVILLFANWIIGLTFISVVSIILAIMKFKTSKKAFALLLIAALVSFSLIFIINPNSTSGGNSIQDDALSYVQKHYPDFSKGSFEDKTISVENMGNDEYVVNGKMLDNGGWEHNVKEGIQVSPNQSQYIVCYLWIDGQNYVMNQPRMSPNASSSKYYYGNYAESATVTVNSEDEAQGGQIEVDPDSQTLTP